MNARRFLTEFGIGILATAGLLSPQAQASFIVTITQVGANVVVTGSGTIDLTALTFNSNTTMLSGMSPSAGILGIGAPGAEAVSIYTGFSGPASFGSGGPKVPSDSGSGNKVGIFDNLGWLGVPQGYVSGNTLSDTSTYNNATLAGLGITPGTYTYTWGSGAHADSFGINADSGTPEPASMTLVPIGLGLLLLAARRRRGIFSRIS